MQGLRKGAVGLLMAAGLAASASVLAQEIDPQDHLRIDFLLEACEGEHEDSLAGMCLFYVVGYREGTVHAAIRAEAIFDVLIGSGRLLDDDPRGLAEKYVQGFCASTEVTMGQLRKVFVKWANDHPERHHEDWNVGLHEAWSEAFPCPE